MTSTKSLAIIERKIKELQVQAEQIRRHEQEGMEQLRAVIAKYKLVPAQVRSVMSSLGGQSSMRSRPKSKTPPKYRSLDNAAIVWSGRGRKPSWIVSGLKNGRTIDQFLIREERESPSDPRADTVLEPSDFSRQAQGSELVAPIPGEGSHFPPGRQST